MVIICDINVNIKRKLLNTHLPPTTLSDLKLYGPLGMRVLTIQALLCWLAVPAFPVFTFSDSFYPPAPPSFASLTRNVELPNTFILCSSSRLARIDDRGIFSILGQDGSQWLSVSFFQHPNIVIMWASWDDGWYRLGILENPRLNYWYHVCLQVDTPRNEITGVVNGKFVGSAIGENISNTPTSLQMAIGKWENFNSNEVQFEGSVTNIQLFSPKHNITALSSEPCALEGDLLAWRAGDWRVEGERWLLVEEIKESMCDQGTKYTVAIPVDMEIHMAMGICRKKLSNSYIPHQNTLEEAQKYGAWYFNITGGTCKSVWTPFSDEQIEGKFVNMNDGLETNLFWGKTQPNGGRAENYVKMSPPRHLYTDVQEKSPSVCSSCVLDRSLLLRLDGLCEDSHIGD